MTRSKDPAPKSTTSPVCAPQAASRALPGSPVTNFPMEPETPSAATLTHARPWAPTAFASASKPSISLRVSAAPPGRRIALTMPPFSMASEKTRNPRALAGPETSTSSSELRRSGLSLPKRAMASS